MHSSHVVGGISVFDYSENDLTRRANQWHIFSIPPSTHSQADQVPVIAIGTSSLHRFQIVFHFTFRKYPKIEDFSDEAFETIA
jgi:hypothetical protein